MKVNIAMQCLDRRTKQIGSFGFRKDKEDRKHLEHYSVTPVFDSVKNLIDYLMLNNIAH